MAEIAGCHGCYNAQWDADGCTCRIDGLLVGNSAKGCTYRICDEEPETVSEDYERGFKDGYDVKAWMPMPDAYEPPKEDET